MSLNITTRFPPSPTGLLQAGNVRTAIFNYLFARKHKGKFILRIEDTDRERSKKEYEDSIVETMQWLGFEYDEFYRQSDNTKRHSEALKTLIEQDVAYISKETPKEVGQRGEVIRLRNPNTVVTFTDVIRGPISVDTTDLGDFIIGRSITEPLYHFGVVVDDTDEGVTHVIRGEDHISNTPRQILIQRALGVQEPPVYVHLPLVLGTDKQKLSKRRGAKAVLQYRDEGFIPEAMINYLTLLGWHPEGEQEVFTLEELIQLFDIDRIQKGAGVFDEVKLRWFNQEHLRKLTLKTYIERLELYLETTPGKPRYSYLEHIAHLLKERYQTFGDAKEALMGGEFSFMEDVMETPSVELLLQGAKVDATAVKTHLLRAKELLANTDLKTAAAVQEVLFPYATEVGKAAVLWPLRVALSGKERSPDPFTLVALLGKERTLARIEQAAALF